MKDIKAISDYISLDSIFYAKRFIAKLIDRIDQLIEFPESGRVVHKKNILEIRELIEGNYRIFYRLQKDKITILRIHNAARKKNQITRTFSIQHFDKLCGAINA